MKKRIMSRIIALALAAVMIAGTLAACGSNNKEAGTTETPAAEEGAAEEGAVQEGSDTPLVVGIRDLSQKFSMFFNESDYDKTIAVQTQVALIESDRSGAPLLNGKTGETLEYNGTPYEYMGMSDVTVTMNADNTVYNFKMREDVTFSDGEPVTADDAIFSMYVLADPSYDGMQVFNASPIKGLKNYQANSTAADSVTADDVAAYIKEMPEELQKAIGENIIAPTLTAEKDWCTENYEAQGMASAEEFFVAAYSTDEAYDAAGKDYDTIVNDVIAMYGHDYKKLGTNYAADETYYDADVLSIAESNIIEAKKAAGEGEEVPNIEGIKKLGDYEFEVTTDGFDATFIYIFTDDMSLSPLHYYGDEAQYDYDNNKFGFTRGDLSTVKAKNDKPMGAGPYKFIKYENKVVYFEANENYYKGAPKVKNLQFKETKDADMIPGVQQGTVDLADPDGSKKSFEQIGGINGTGELSGDVIVTNRVDNLGYGYMGLNSNTINVGGEPSSDASKDLRKAIATILAVYRDVSIDSYYGDAASVINYPISNTSWAAPQKSDEGYEVAYSKDVEGNPIYTDGMSADEKYAKALEASLGFFEAAGYTVEGGKLSAAPAGAKLSYEIIIPADGIGDHPSFAILTDAKAALASIGFTLEINDPTDSNILWDKLNANTQEMWTAAWQATPDPDMYQLYHSESLKSNYSRINDKDLDTYILDARTNMDQEYRKSLYKECMNIIMDWGVEVPIYQRQNCIIFSPERINADTFTKDVTTSYKWYKEIEKIEIK